MHDRYSFLARLIKQFAVLLTIGLVVTVLTDISKLHLLWWIPVSYILPHYFSFWRLKIKRFLRGETPAYRKKLKGY